MTSPVASEAGRPSAANDSMRVHSLLSEALKILDAGGFPLELGARLSEIITALEELPPSSAG